MKRSPLHDFGNKATPQIKHTIKGKKLVFIMVFLVLLIFIFSQVLYFYVIPRITIDLKTVYHEATGGGGTGGSINVNTKFINSGTVEVENFIILVTILDNSKTLLVNETYNQGTMSPGNSHELKFTTNGDTFKTFYIIVELQFNNGNNDYSKKYLYETHEDSMNIGFEDQIFDWGF